MSNHISLFKKLHIESEYTCKLTLCSSEYNVPCVLQRLKDEYYYATMKNTCYSALFKADGQMIVPFDEHKYLGCSEDTLLIFSRRNLSIQGISLSSGDVLYTVRCYDDTKAEFLRIYRDDCGVITSQVYAFIFDSSKRYQIYTEYGVPVADKIIDYKIFYTQGEEYFDRKIFSVAVRFENSFGILQGNNRITKCECIVELKQSSSFFTKSDHERLLVSGLNHNDAPYLIGLKDDNGRLYYNYVTTSGEINVLYSIDNVYESEYKNLYLCKVRYYKNLKDTYEYRYIYLDKEGKVLNDRYFKEATPIVSNRAFVWYEDDEYGILMDENGRVIKADTYKIRKIDEMFEKKSYGGFIMTLARVYLSDGRRVYIDKEFNIYPDIDDVIITKDK